MTLFTNPGGDQEDDATVPATFLRKLGLRRNPSVLAFNAAPIFELATFDWYLMVLTAGVTPGGPTWGGQALSAAHSGLEVMIDWIQDGVGGRAITYNAPWKTGGAVALVTTLSTRTIDVFRWDGVSLRLLSRQTGQA